MDEQLKQLAENYYAVARHLEAQGEYYIRMANTLGHIADAMCENKAASFIPENHSPDSASEKS